MATKAKKVHDPLGLFEAVTVTDFPATKKMAARTRVKCGCCWEHFSIYSDAEDNYLEIGGVMATKAQWREVFKDLLQEDRKQGDKSRSSSGGFFYDINTGKMY